MARLNQKPKTNTYTQTHTYEGGAAWRLDNAAIELLFTASVTFAGEDTFYESAAQREQRLVDLTHAATKRNPTTVEQIADQLRNDFKIRTASIIVACEYVAAGGPNPRKVIDSVCQRADEPGEVLAYWASRYGRDKNTKGVLKIPRGIKMGLGDAVRRLYTQRNVLKYDTGGSGFRFADVIELCHVHPVTEIEQDGESKTIDKSGLFRYVMDNRHHNDGPTQLVTRFDDNRLEMLRKNFHLSKIAEDKRRTLLREHGPDMLAEGGYTWERLSSWLPGGMDAEAWEAVIPSMGVMALIRNLRNFDDANISRKRVENVIHKITDPVEVERSRIFPYQVLLAYQHAPSDNWKRALGDTVDLASGNLPRLDGSLLVIDTSSSMRGTLSSKSKADRVTVAGLQAASIARHSRNCDVVIFGNTNRKITHEVRGKSLLGAAKYIYDQVGSVGHATFGHTAIKDHFDPDRHQRAIIFTDDQMHDSMDKADSHVYRNYYGSRGVGPADISHVPQVITFNVGGYGTQSTIGKGRITVAGFSDAIFTAIAKIMQLETTAPETTTV